MRAALVRKSTGLVENIIEYDINGSFQIPAEYEIVVSATANIDDIYNKKEFVRQAESTRKLLDKTDLDVRSSLISIRENLDRLIQQISERK